jgi:hypothetical protein
MISQCGVAVDTKELKFKPPLSTLQSDKGRSKETPCKSESHHGVWSDYDSGPMLLAGDSLEFYWGWRKVLYSVYGYVQAWLRGWDVAAYPLEAQHPPQPKHAAGRK